MPGKLRGIFFKGIVNSLLGGSVNVLFPDIKAAIDKMHDDEWYDWDKFCSFSSQIAAKMTPSVIKSVGRKVVTGTKDIYLSQGFDTLEKLLKGYPEMFNANIKGVPRSGQVALLEYKEGRAKYAYPSGQPKEMIQGYFEGFFEIYKQPIKSFMINTVRDGNFEVTVTW